MRFYFDTSALLKRAIAEAQSAELDEFFNWAIGRGDSCVTSKLGRLEMARVLRRHGDTDTDRNIRLALSDVNLYPIDDEVIDQAEALVSNTLLSLDAIHLATVITRQADAMVTYDERLRQAAFEAGIPVIQPGGTLSGDLPPGWAWIESVIPMDEIPMDDLPADF